ncbi:beta-N-acetylhexosaminidase [Pontibacter korlensis]|uniref:beta-N-acetylhexosaminidase n=1 Tax=Pontibacter korlensis TaxID=400092 RepID=A0A0E3UYR6_9BACT|nr:beta-N-acetylhexosaminidase [Pontibacter korlensis]AKD05377.1 beta-N-acetylglucosaminidase [Pontibacter korlensis]
MRTRTFLYLAFLLLPALASAQSHYGETYAVIPKPLKLQPHKGSFTLNTSTRVVFDKAFGGSPALQAALQALPIALGKAQLANSSTTPGKGNTLHFVQDSSLRHAEGYRLHVQRKGIIITYKKPQGAFYAIKTLQQLVNPVTGRVPRLLIEDQPRFAYRGVMLDVSRHFFPLEFIKKYVDALAFYKINTLHLHLTDDQGWRIEIKKYPKLQETAAFREQTLIGHLKDTPQVFDGKRYGGYYTQQELRDLVKYAESRFVTIVPEIELPGHAQAALAAYPELGCIPDTTYSVGTRWGIYQDIYCPSEATFNFLEEVLSEVIDIFPGKYIHIGGDEAPKDRWKASPLAQEVIRQHNLQDEHELQSYFVRRIETFLNSKGRAIIGWDEILEGGLAPNATVMSWRGEEGGIAAARLHHNVIMTPHPFVYLDAYQTPEGRDLEPLAIGGFLALEKVYSYNPTPASLSEQEKSYIMGVQANVWTEYMPTPEHVEHMTFPRACALAETAWTQEEQKAFPDFRKRLLEHTRHFNAWNLNFATYFLKDTNSQ